MNFEELQKTWQSQKPGTKLTIDADLLLKEVQHNKRSFETTIFWRDVREVGVAFLLVPCFSYAAIKFDDWVWFLPALACLGVGIFMLVDRWVQRKKKPETSDPLKTTIETSLIQVNHQIWLLRNVFWWYLLPLGGSIVAVHCAWCLRVVGLWEALKPLGWGFGGVLLYWGIYWLNQQAVQEELEPRRRELEALLASLAQ